MNLKSAIILALLGFTLLSCAPQNQADVSKPLFSDSAAATNVAVLMTAYGHTPGYINYFENDMQSMKTILEDPKGNYGYQTILGHNVSAREIYQKISEGASQVSPDGTLNIFITAHGSPNAHIAPKESGAATVGYREIIQAIASGREGKPPFKRLVLFISACYSGSWLTSTKPEPYFSEYLAMTSVAPRLLSPIGVATSALLQTFKSIQDPATTYQQFFDMTKRRYPTLQYEAHPVSILQSPLMNRDIYRPHLTVALVPEKNDPSLNALYFAGTSDISALRLCKPQVEDCSEEKTSGVNLEKISLPQVSSRNAFRLSNSLAMDQLSGVKFRLVALNDENGVVATRTFMIHKP